MIIEQLKTLVEMQKLDDEISRYKKLQEQLPKQLSEIVQRVEQATADLLAVETERAELNKVQRTMDGDIKQHTEQCTKYANQLADIKTNKEYKALNSEIAYLREKISELESEQLLLMEQETEIKTRIATAKEELAAAEKDKRDQEGELRAQIDSLEAKIEQTRAERNKMAVTLPTSLIKQYGNMIKNRNSVAVAWNKDGSCSACGFVLRPQVRIELQLFKKIILCENCGRILVDQGLNHIQTAEEK